MVLVFTYSHRWIFNYDSCGQKPSVMWFSSAGFNRAISIANRWFIDNQNSLNMNFHCCIQIRKTNVYISYIFTLKLQKLNCWLNFRYYRCLKILTCFPFYDLLSTQGSTWMSLVVCPSVYHPRFALNCFIHAKLRGQITMGFSQIKLTPRLKNTR